MRHRYIVIVGIGFWFASNATLSGNGPATCTDTTRQAVPACTSPASCTTSCSADPPCKPPCPPTQGGPPPPAQPPLGFFQAPPTTGTVVGASQGAGVQGAEITFPEVRLKFPSIRFPSAFRTRTNPHMVTERSVAPFIEGQSVAMGVTAHPNWTQAPPTQGVSPPTQGFPPPCTSPVPVQGTPTPCTSPVPTQGSPPACDMRTISRLDALELERRELELRLAGLQALLKRSTQQSLSTNQPGQSAYGVADPQLPVGMTQGVYAPQGAQPIRPPLPPPDEGVRRPPVPLQIAPTSYLAEPGQLPVTLVAVDAVIRQPPRPPVARITGLR